jgi:phage tail-like protein
MTELLSSFRFRVGLRRSPTAPATSVADATNPAPDAGNPLDSEGAFQECSGLEIEMEVGEYHEGGRNDGVIRRVGRAKYSNIVLKRGMFLGDDGRVNVDFWRWLQEVVAGHNVRRYDGTIEVLGPGPDQQPLATWSFVRGLPAKIKGPELNAKTGEIALEELHIAHEGLTLALPDVGGPA